MTIVRERSKVIQAMMDSFDRGPLEERQVRPRKPIPPWHPKRRGVHEPECAGNQWRQRDRQAVIYMRDMTDSHLQHAIRFASTMPQHADRLSGLLAEKGRRSK